MSRFPQSLAVCALAMFGLWGCARGPVSSNGDSTKSSEEKIAKLEDEIRTTIVSRDQYRKRLNAAEEALTQTRQDLKQELTKALKEQEELKTAVKNRTAERDNLETQYDGFRRGLRDFVDPVGSIYPAESPAYCYRSAHRGSDASRSSKPGGRGNGTGSSIKTMTR